jgi:glycosyltransferase involved in cell wall biosynthesis
MGARPRLRVHALIDSLTLGGAEMLLVEFARVAGSAEVDLDVTSLRADPENPAAIRLREVGIEPAFVPVASLWRARDVRAVRRHLARAGPDLLHTHLGYADYLGCLAARTLGLAAVSTLHADYWDGGVRDRTRFRLMALARRTGARRVLAVSDAARRTYLAAGWDKPERVVTVRNGIAGRAEPGSGASVRSELGLAPDDLVVTMVSALRRGKGHAVAADAVRGLRERFPRLRLVIVGDGESRAEVERLVAPLGEAAILTGYRADVMRILDATDVLLQPSETEAFPTSVVEAMAAAVPVVASAVGGIPEAVEPGVSGALISPPPTAREVATALGALLDDDDARRRLGAGGQSRFEREFTGERWAERVRAVYDDVLRRP